MRQEKVREIAELRGMAGAIIWSRGGGSIDMAADVLYLTNHYSQQPYIGDEAGIWSGRSHAALLLPVGGPSVLCVDLDWWRRDLVVADDVKSSTDLPLAVADAIRELHLSRSSLALVGMSSMSAAAYTRFRDALPKVVFERDDFLVEGLRIFKSSAERAVIRHAAAVGSRAVDAIVNGVVEGTTEGEAVAAGAGLLAEEGAVLWDAPCASGPFSHSFAHARLPSYDAVRRLVRGDLFHVDCYGAWGGYCFDIARSRVVGDEPRDDQLALIETAIAAVEAICNAVRPGVTGGMMHEVAREAFATSKNAMRVRASSDQLAIPRLVGHGVGLRFESPWLVDGSPDRIEAGMHLSVEVLVGNKTVGGAMYEEQGLVTDDGLEIISTARKRWW